MMLSYTKKEQSHTTQAKASFFSPALAQSKPLPAYSPTGPSIQKKASHSTSQAVSLRHISQKSSQAQHDANVTSLYAGTPVPKSAPGGIRYISGRSTHGSLGNTAGLTLRKNAAAFTAPSFQTSNTHRRVSGRVEHFATVQADNTSDVTHECFYPAAGDHLYPIIPRAAAPQNRVYYRISSAFSLLIRQGEQEHLNDLERAYNLTYGLIKGVINGMSGQQFGPASTPAEADQLAARQFGQRVPSALGTQPGNWPVVLNRLLAMTSHRDRQGWHSVSNGPPITEGNRIIHPLQQESTFRVGQVPSSQVVHY